MVKHGEDWRKLYKDLFFLGKGYRTDAGGSELYRLSVEAYEECLQLKPDDAQWHAGFADLLANRAYWDGWMSGPTQDAFRALTEIHTALQIAPNDAKVKEIAENIYWLFSEGMKLTDAGYDFPWLTQTPTPHPPTETIAPALDPSKVSGEYTSPWLNTLGWAAGGVAVDFEARLFRMSWRQLSRGKTLSSSMRAFGKTMAMGCSGSLSCGRMEILIPSFLV